MTYFHIRLTSKSAESAPIIVQSDYVNLEIDEDNLVFSDSKIENDFRTGSRRHQMCLIPKEDIRTVHASADYAGINRQLLWPSQ